MTDDQLLRYSRHILLDEVGIEGQERILATHALVIGAGGLGSPVVQGLNTLDIGLATTGGLGIVLLAIILDRITQALGRRQ